MKTNMHVARVHEWNVFQVLTGKHNDNTSVANPKKKVFYRPDHDDYMCN